MKKEMKMLKALTVLNIFQLVYNNIIVLFEVQKKIQKVKTQKL